MIVLLQEVLSNSNTDKAKEKQKQSQISND